MFSAERGGTQDLAGIGRGCGHDRHIRHARRCDHACGRSAVVRMEAAQLRARRSCRPRFPGMASLAGGQRAALPVRRAHRGDCPTYRLVDLRGRGGRTGSRAAVRPALSHRGLVSSPARLLDVVAGDWRVRRGSGRRDRRACAWGRLREHSGPARRRSGNARHLGAAHNQVHRLAGRAWIGHVRRRPRAAAHPGRRIGDAARPAASSRRCSSWAAHWGRCSACSCPGPSASGR